VCLPACCTGGVVRDRDTVPPTLPPLPLSRRLLARRDHFRLPLTQGQLPLPQRILQWTSSILRAGLIPRTSGRSTRVWTGISLLSRVIFISSLSILLYPLQQRRALLPVRRDLHRLSTLPALQIRLRLEARKMSAHGAIG
jgi:hypothetical protein